MWKQRFLACFCQKPLDYLEYFPSFLLKYKKEVGWPQRDLYSNIPHIIKSPQKLKTWITCGMKMTHYEISSPETRPASNTISNLTLGWILSNYLSNCWFSWILKIKKNKWIEFLWKLSSISKGLKSIKLEQFHNYLF